MSRNALVVGINHYHHLPILKAAGNDAEAIAQRLSQNNSFKVRRLPERIISAEGSKHPAMSQTQRVTQFQLKEALRQLFLPEGEQIPETALFHFSGHGIADYEGYDKGYLATSDTEPENPATGLSLRWLRWLLSQSKVRQQVVWLDCCHSGALMLDVGAANPGAESVGSGGDRHRCFIAASRDFEGAWEDLNSPYGVLTKALLEGLDPTRHAESSVNSFDLVAHVKRALAGELQTPICTVFGEAIELTSLRQVTEQRVDAVPEDSGICPYKGLEFFENNDEDPKYFFGRERLVDQLLDHVRTQNFLALVGASGNGKSSVLRAGLLHQLGLGQRLAGSEAWRVLVTRPDEEPMKSLARAFVPKTEDALERAETLGRVEKLLAEGSAGLRRLVESSDSRVVLVIDQFEEVFTRLGDKPEDEAARLRFFECLMGALTGAKEKLCLVIAMRADFVGKCLAQDYAGLAQRVKDFMVPVLPLSEAELKAAICEPARRVGLTVEKELVAAIVKDTKDAPGSLPLLQYALKELWQRRASGVLRYADYVALGGIEGTLDRRATETYNSFEAAQQRTVRHIFQQLTQLGEGTEDTRRRVFMENLIAEPQHSEKRVRAVVTRLSDAENRLLVTSEVVRKENENEKDTVEQQRQAIVDVAHEALIRHWILLRRWIEENRDLLGQQRRIEQSSVVWQEWGEQKGYLLQGVPLIEAAQFEKQQSESFPLSEMAKRFVKKSVWQRHWSRLKMASWLIILVVMIIELREYRVREKDAKINYALLDSEDSALKKRAAQDLVTGCAAQENYSVVPEYFLERIFGSCHSLRSENLSNADLSGVNLSNANLGNADLSMANLSNANLSSANLSSANLAGAQLSDANLSRANLSDAFLLITNLSDTNLSSANFSGASLTETNLSSAIFLSTDLRMVYTLIQGLTQEQLTTEPRPLICNSPLPEEIKIEGGMNRDCERVAEVLLRRYPQQYETLENAQRDVDFAKEKTWD